MCPPSLQQPAAEIFYRFDQLLLLKRGGDVVYFGSVENRAAPMVEYFQNITGTPLPTKVNPANWMLDLLSQPVDFPTEFQRSTMKTSVVHVFVGVLMTPW